MKELEVLRNEKVEEKMIRGSEIVMNVLIEEKVKVIFGYPGGAIMPVYDALYDYSDKIEHILVRHEQGAIHAAQGYARASGRHGVVLATSGPGATNLVTGLADAMIDSTPVVCITGQVFAHLLGSDAFQETDIMNITSPVTKWNYQVSEACELEDVLGKAFYIANTGRPGPVLIDITKNAQLESIPYKRKGTFNGFQKQDAKSVICIDAIKRAAALINKAERPFVVFGQGVILGNAEKEFRRFIEKADLPAASTILGLSALPTDHRLNAGMLGMHGNYAPNKLTNECDVLIAVGMRFDDRVTGRLDVYAKQAKVIHMDIDPSEIDKNVKTDIAIVGDCKESLPELTKQIARRCNDRWKKRFEDLYDSELSSCIEQELFPSASEITMGEVVRLLNKITKGDAIVVTDVGQHQMVACRYTSFNKSKSSITSGGLGTMGFALPAAIGAKYGAPNRTVIAIAGDGGFQMNVQELGTIMQSNVDIKVLILNNQYLGMVRQWQDLFHERRYSFVEMKNPDFVKLAGAYGIKGNRVAERSELESSIKTMVDHDGCYLLEVMVAKEQNVFPMVEAGKGVGDIRLK